MNQQKLNNQQNALRIVPRLKPKTGWSAPRNKFFIAPRTSECEIMAFEQYGQVKRLLR